MTATLPATPISEYAIIVDPKDNVAVVKKPTAPGLELFLPDGGEVRVMAEVLPGYEITSWTAMIGPANMKADLVAQVNALTARALADPQLVHRNALAEVEDGGGTFKVLNLPFRMSGAKVSVAKRMSTLGEHTRAYLKETGLSEHEIAAFAGKPPIAARG